MSKKTTEADLEARIAAALKIAFPLLPTDSVRHQTTFSFKFGGKTITVDGASQSKVSARSDVLVYLNDKPLAVLELKRPSVSLTKEDEQQGLSYARVLFPSPPLVLVTNGKESRLLETHTGQPWEATNRNEITIAALLKNAATVAEGEMKEAVSALMRTNSQVWTQAIRQASLAAVAQLTGSWGDRFLPFVEGVQFPRKVTSHVQHMLKQGQKMIIVSGAPLIGKSSVLREFVENGNDDYCTLFVEADESTSILRLIADLLEDELQWPVTPEEARRWLKDVSKSDGPKLFIVVDGIGANFKELRAEISDFCSDTFGKSLSVIIELDENVAEKVILDSKRERLSKIGRKTKVVKVEALDDDEFNLAAKVLWDRQIVFTKGSQCSPEYRLPWILRAMVAPVASNLGDAPTQRRCGLPPVLSFNLLQIARKALEDKGERRRKLRCIAIAIVQDAEDKDRSPELSLWSSSVFIVLRKSAEGQLSVDDLRSLEEEGLIRSRFLDSGEAIYIIRSPELVASEVAYVLGEILCEKKDTSDEGAAWLEGIAGAIPLGDLVAAQGILDQAKFGGGISVGIIASLLSRVPTQGTMNIGTQFLMSSPDGVSFKGKLTDKGVVITDKHGVEESIDVDLNAEPFKPLENIRGWLILAHVASVAFEVVEVETENCLGRGETELLLDVGSCPFVLRNPSSNLEMNEFACHESLGGEMIACHGQGTIEVITNSIFIYLSRERLGAEAWIDEVLVRNSVPLLSRVSLALHVASSLADHEFAEFAQKMLHEKIDPVFQDFCFISETTPS